MYMFYTSWLKGKYARVDEEDSPICLLQKSQLKYKAICKFIRKWKNLENVDPSLDPRKL